MKQNLQRHYFYRPRVIINSRNGRPDLNGPAMALIVERLIEELNENDGVLDLINADTMPQRQDIKAIQKQIPTNSIYLRINLNPN